MKYLYHLCSDENGSPMDAAFVDGNGFKHTIPYDDPTEFQNEHLAERIVHHLQYYGMVEVHTVKSKTGVQFDMDDARKRAKANLAVSERQCVTEYVKTQLEDRVRHNLSPLPPEGRALQSCIKGKVNLLKYGIRPVGWEAPYEMEALPAGMAAAPSSTPTNLERIILQLQDQLASQQILINSLLAGDRAAKSGMAKLKKGRERDKVEVSPTPPEHDDGYKDGEGDGLSQEERDAGVDLSKVPSPDDDDTNISL